jgi:hypothetical protein
MLSPLTLRMGTFENCPCDGYVSHRGGEHPAAFEQEERMTYQKPVVQRFGTLREITLGSGPNTPGDATNLYHRS